MHNRIKRVAQMPNIPQPFAMRDWAELARDYDSLVFDLNAAGDFLPLVWLDHSRKNAGRVTFGLPSYVSPHQVRKDGMQESINCAAALLGATLVGIDKSSHRGYNWIEMLENFYNTENGELLFLNRADTKTGHSFWYEIYPHVLLYSLLNYYSGMERLDQIMKKTADRWLEACVILGGNRIDFDFTAYDFIKKVPVSNGRWKEPEAAAGIAFILYMAYARWKEEKYLEGAAWCLQYLNQRETNPYYELLLPYGAYIAARYNAQHGKAVDVEKIVNWCFDGDSACRPGWGVIAERWGEFDCHGLCGSLTDWGQRWDCMTANALPDYDPELSGYAFAGNTFSMAAGLVAMVRYDASYARDIGKWMLNAANNARLFYADCHPPKGQSCAFWKSDEKHVIAYEGLRKKWDLQSPYATGDAIRYSWGSIDFGLYGSSHVGIFGGIVARTNEEAILRLDCIKTDYFNEGAYPTYLYYNPYDSEKLVEMDAGEAKTDIYDAVSHRFMARGVTGRIKVPVGPDSAVVAVHAAAGGVLSRQEGKLLVNGIPIDYHAD